MTWNHVKKEGQTTFKAQTKDGLKACVARWKKLSPAKRKTIMIVTPSVMISHRPKNATKKKVAKKAKKAKKYTPPPKIIIPQAVKNAIIMGQFKVVMPFHESERYRFRRVPAKAVAILGDMVKFRMDRKVNARQTWPWTFVMKPVEEVLEAMLNRYEIQL